MKAIQFGAGNIGRGFIGAVLSQAGFEVVFADVVADLLGQINTRKEYTVHVMDTVSRDITIKDITLKNGFSQKNGKRRYFYYVKYNDFWKKKEKRFAVYANVFKIMENIDEKIVFPECR